MRYKDVQYVASERVSEASIHQTPDSKQRRMKRSQTIFEIDFWNGFELVVFGIMQ